jgi:phosphoglycolate phosphatase
MHLFFDLDGTLTDSSPGIVRCINHALVELGRAPSEEAALRPMVGTPLWAIFETLIGTNDTTTIDRAIAAYRARFNDVGMFENSVFPGVASALAELRARGHGLQVVTGKPAVPARRIVDHFGMGQFFDAVHGPALTDRSCDKAVLISDALEVSGGRAEDAAMIGDRAEDVHAARANGVRAVAAAWGYGRREELVAARPDLVAETVADFVRWVDRQS